ncbi:MAG: 2-amino-4-hydroxy-6-hydroxymethyldihydropteridine diphosphokinase [Marinicellaceae bacterium]
MSVICYLGLGSNIGDSDQNILQAIKYIAGIENVKVIKIASFYLTKAWGKTNQADFVNTAIEIECCLTAHQLLHELQTIEVKVGRVKAEKWGPRSIDIDILTFGDMLIDQADLKIPHPFLTQRSFVLAPLYELNKKLEIIEKGPLKSYINKNLFATEIIDKYVAQ